MRLRVLLAAVAAVVPALLCPSQAQETRQFLVAPFLCSVDSPLPSLAQDREKYLHEFKDVSQTQHQVCALVEQFQILRQGAAPRRQQCETYQLASYTIMCRGGTVSAARWWAATDQGRRSGVRIDGDTLYVPFKGGGGWQLGGGGITGLELGKRGTSYAPLPAGYGFPTNFPVRQVTLPWTSLAIPVSGRLPDRVAAPASAPAWVRLLAAWSPWPQLVLALPLLAYGAIAITGLRVHEAPPGRRRRCAIALGATLLALALTPLPAGLPAQAHRAAEADLARGRSALAAIERDRAELARIVRLSSATGMVEPITMTDMQRIAELTRPRSLVVSRTPQPNPALWAALLLAPALAFPLFYVLPFLRGRHHLFVPHPAAAQVQAAIEEQRPVWGQALAAALQPDLSEVARPPPWWHSENLRKKATALADKLKADTEIARAAREHASALAALKDAERQLQAAKRKRGER